MLLNETVQSFFTGPTTLQLSSEVTDKNVLMDLEADEIYSNTGSFFDDNGGNCLFGSTDQTDILFRQKDKIMKYRHLSMTPDVTEAVDEIVNEIIFSYDDKMPLKIVINQENNKLVEAINEKFVKICNLINIKRNLFSIVRRGYVDGQMIMHCAYDNKNTKNGIKSIKMIEPSLLYYNQSKKAYMYIRDDKHAQFTTQIDKSEQYSIEEIVREDFGLYDGKITLSYLDNAIKTANMLKTLEDLLVPMRFSRSISRRIFNVDISDLPNKRGSEVMREHQTKFKYKKFFNNESGEVSNQQHITSMVEDYWFANRSGGKGTTVDTLDETGNLGELNDILYFSKKLYRSLKIPVSRISNNPETDQSWSFDETRTTKEDMKFFMFISRLRLVYSSMFKSILKREIISCGIMNEEEWNSIEQDIQIQFVQENKFIEKMKLEAFISKMGIYTNIQEHQGKLFAVETILQEIFKMSNDEIKDEFKKIKKEEKDPLFANFYKEDDSSSW